MTDAYQPPEDLARLLTRVVERPLGPEGRQRLHAALGDDRDARAYFVRYVALHAMLENKFGDEAVLEVPVEAPELLVARTPNIRLRYVISGIAAALLLAVSLFYTLRRDGAAPAEQPAAVLLEADGARWSTGSEAAQPGGPLPTGRGQLDAGEARIRLASGAVIALQGPVSYELPGGNRFTLHRGKIRAVVPPSARGLVVEAAGLEIVDLGTEFGVAADAAGAVEVHVFVGTVRVNSQIQLKAGEALRVDAKRSGARIKPNRTAFPAVPG